MQWLYQLKRRDTCQRRGPISMPAWMTSRGVRLRSWWQLTRVNAERALQHSECCELQWASWPCSPLCCRWPVLPVHCWDMACRRRDAWCELDVAVNGCTSEMLE